MKYPSFVSEKILLDLFLGQRLRVFEAHSCVKVYFIKKGDITRILTYDNLEYMINRGWVKESALSILFKKVEEMPKGVDDIRTYRLTKLGMKVAFWEYVKRYGK